ncbi:MAG: Rieske (2Fe-2S) protein [Acidobacteriaceae bacterium]|nr:Rieske (2Fe-2S) protein [Acidobacteriaceae bacterium]
MSATPVEVVIGPLSLIPPGEGRNFDVAGERVAVFHTRAGRVFATQAACPHKDGPLADGLVGGNILICPLHGLKFDLSTGDPIMGSCKLKTYSICLNNEGQLVLTL